MNEVVIKNESFALKVIKGTSKKNNTDYYALILVNSKGAKKYVTFSLEDIAQFVGISLIDLVKELG